MPQESMHSWPVARACDWRWSTKGVRSVRVPLLSREAVGLVIMGVSVQTWGGPAGLYFGGLAPTLGASIRSAAASTTYNF